MTFILFSASLLSPCRNQIAFPSKSIISRTKASLSTITHFRHRTTLELLYLRETIVLTFPASQLLQWRRLLFLRIYSDLEAVDFSGTNGRSV